MAQLIANFVVSGLAQTPNTTAITLASFDVAAIPGGIGNITDCCIFVKATVSMFEVGGGTYTAGWQKVAVFRRTSTNNPSLVNAVVDGNQGTGGQIGSADSSTVTLDVSTTTIRLRITPQSGTRDWYGKLEVQALQYA